LLIWINDGLVLATPGARKTNYTIPHTAHPPSSFLPHNQLIHTSIDSRKTHHQKKTGTTTFIVYHSNCNNNRLRTKFYDLFFSKYILTPLSSLHEYTPFIDYLSICRFVFFFRLRCRSLVSDSCTTHAVTYTVHLTEYM
jgi:hypothetical protein